MLTNSNANNIEQTLECGLSGAFHNKINRTGNKTAFGQSFAPQRVPIQQFVQHIISGKAWTQGYFETNRRRKDAFVSARTLALDLDDKISVADALQEKLIRDCALLVHPSPSSTPEHPKTRVVFVLSEAVTSIKRWEALQRALIRHFEHLHPDPACKDAARMFYGSDKPGAHVNLGAVLPLTIAGNFTHDEAEQDYLKATQTHLSRTFNGGHGGELSEDLVRDVERALGVAGAPLNGEGFTRKAVACPVGHHEHDHDRPAAFWHPGIRALKCFKCGETYNTHQVAAALNIDIKPYYRKVESFKSDRQVNLHYISHLHPDDLLKHRAVLVKSPIGTGKTEAAANLIRRLGQTLDHPLRVLALTHRQALADDLATRLSRSGHIFECYKGLEALDLRRIDRLVICYDSVWKLAVIKEKLPQYDLIIIDEIEQFHQHLGGDTMRGSAPERAYRVLCQLVQETPHFLGMDAHASDISRNWLKQIAGDVTTIENTYRAEKGTLLLHQSRNTAVRKAMSLIEQNEGVVVIATNTRNMAKKLGHIFEERLGKEAVRVIHGGNSNDKDVQQFIRHINREIVGLKLLIYSPSLGTGVDITAPVRGVVGIFSPRPLAPADMHQMLGRCRNVQERHVWVQNQEGTQETDWQVIYQQHEQNAITTGQHCYFNDAGILAINEVQAEMLKLLSMLEARRNHSMNNPRPHFIQLAQAEGYQVAFVEGDDEAVRNAIKAATETLKAEEKAAALKADPVTHEEMEYYQMYGENTPEIYAGYERFKIEDCVGQPITPGLYDDLHTSNQRDQLRRFTELDADEDTLRNQDRQEAQENTLLSKRKHRAMRRKLIHEAFVAVWGEDYDLLNIPELPASVIIEHMSGYISIYSIHLRTYCGWRSDQSKNPVALLRWLLKQIGLSLESKQVMLHGERYRVYGVNQEGVKKMQGYAFTRREHLSRKQITREAQRQQVEHLKMWDYSKHGYKTISPQSEQGRNQQHSGLFLEKKE